MYTAFAYLNKQAGVGPVFDQEQAVRLFDIAFINCRSKQYHVILSDGTRHRCDNILERLKVEGIDRFFVKISASYMVNMLLVAYPIAHPQLRVTLQPEVFDGLLRGLRKADLEIMLTSGRGIKGAHVTEFLEDRNSLNYDGWDHFVSLS